MNIASATQQSLGLASNVGITLDGVSILMANRYPTAAGILVAAGLSAEYSTSSATPVATVQVLSADKPANCQFTYTEATATAPPTLTTADVTGC
jgi:MSHA pilin protein MshA